MSHAERAADERVLLDVPEHALPSSCAEAFDLFERDLEQAIGERPPHLDRRLGGVEAAFLPDYAAIQPASWLRVLGITALFWFLVLLVTGLLGVVALLGLPRSWSGPAASVVYGLGGLAMIAVTVWQVGVALRENRRKRARGRPAALGVFLLADALVRRTAQACSYFPRTSLCAVYKEPIRSAGGATTSPTGRTIGFSGGISYRDADGAEQKQGLFMHSASPAADTGQLDRLRRWFDETG